MATLFLHPVMGAAHNRKELIGLALQTNSHPFKLLSGTGVKLSHTPKKAARTERNDFGPTGGAA